MQTIPAPTARVLFFKKKSLYMLVLPSPGQPESYQPKACPLGSPTEGNPGVLEKEGHRA